MAIQTPILYNAVKNGYIAGALAGSQPPSTSGGYTALLGAAEALAAQVDANIGVDSTFAASATTSNVLGTTLSTAAISNAYSTKLSLITGLAFGAGFQRAGSADTTQADYTALALGISTAYAQIVTGDSLT